MIDAQVRGGGRVIFDPRNVIIEQAAVTDAHGEMTLEDYCWIYITSEMPIKIDHPYTTVAKAILLLLKGQAHLVELHCEEAIAV